MNIPEKSYNEPFTSEELELVESKLGVKLPESYINLMKSWNGGGLDGEHEITAVDYSEDLSYYLPGGVWSVCEIAGITPLGDLHSIMMTPYMLEEWQLPSGLVLIGGDGNAWIAFDYREQPNDPPVIFLESNDLRTAVLAHNFQDFLDRLVVAPPYVPSGN